MIEDRLAEVRERHQQFERLVIATGKREPYGACKYCRQPWPCDAVAMADEVERLRIERDGLWRFVEALGEEIPGMINEIERWRKGDAKVSDWESLVWLFKEWAIEDVEADLQQARDQAVEVAVQRGVEIVKLQGELNQAEKEVERLRSEGKDHGWLIECQR